jgi:hypothetical protein
MNRFVSTIFNSYIIIFSPYLDSRSCICFGHSDHQAVRRQEEVAKFLCVNVKTIEQNAAQIGDKTGISMMQ